MKKLLVLLVVVAQSSSLYAKPERPSLYDQCMSSLKRVEMALQERQARSGSNHYLFKTSLNYLDQAAESVGPAHDIGIGEGLFDIRWSQRTWAVLKFKVFPALGIEAEDILASDFAKMVTEQWLYDNVRGCGPKTTAEIKIKLHEVGLGLRDK